MDRIWNQAWRIVVRELKIDRYYLAASTLFIAYMAFFSGLMVSMISEEARFSFVADLFFWAVASMTGYYFSRRMMKFLAEDSYTQMLAYYRVLPISPKVIALARCQQLAFATAFNGILLFGLMYALHSGIREQLDPGAFVAFALLWTGFGLISNSAYVVLELSVRGKAYFWYSLALVVALTLLVLILHFSGIHIVEGTMRISKEHGVFSPIAWSFFAAGVLSIYVSYRALVIKLPKRSLA